MQKNIPQWGKKVSSRFRAFCDEIIFKNAKKCFLKTCKKEKNLKIVIQKSFDNSELEDLEKLHYSFYYG